MAFGGGGESPEYVEMNVPNLTKQSRLKAYILTLLANITGNINIIL